MKYLNNSILIIFEYLLKFIIEIILLQYLFIKPLNVWYNNHNLKTKNWTHSRNPFIIIVDILLCWVDSLFGVYFLTVILF